MEVEWSFCQNTSIEMDKGMTIQKPSLRIAEARELDWTVRADALGVHKVSVNLSGHRFPKNVIVSDGRLARVSPHSVNSSVWGAILNPGTEPIAENSFLKRIEIRYPSRSIDLFGLKIHWLIVFFVLTTIVAFAFKRMFKVEILRGFQLKINQSLVTNRTSQKSIMRDLLPGVLSLLSAVPVGISDLFINETFTDRPERAVMIIGVLFAILFILPPAVYLISKRRLASPWRLGLILIATISVLLVSVYIYWVSSFVLFPADILTWSEGDFVNDILKFRLSYPLYSAQVNNDSFTYSPGSRLLTYFLAWLSGNGTSIPFYRMIQVVYTLLAAGISMFCCRKLVDITFPGRQSGDSKLWVFAWLPLFFLIGTNS